jgi:transcriptional regulator with PAS, ATPase and Fis domain
VGVGERVPGLDRNVPVADWAGRLPDGWQPDWLNEVSLDGQVIGAILIIPDKGRPAVNRAPLPGSEHDPGRSSFDHIIGRSPATTALIQLAAQLVGRHVPVLIEGETGVGKELLARAIHNDADGRRPFIAFNCGAVSRELIADELFGHVAGAFTGATREGRPGRFELAHQGTMCLDEIGELHLDLQPVLLRVLEEGIVYRVGDTRPRPVNVRLIAITNRDLRAEVEAGRFRRDLYYRISVASITVPPLRDRVEDIEPLVDHFNRMLSIRHHLPMRRFDPDVLAVLRRHRWPGNVRELRNLVERLLLFSTNGMVTLDDLPAELTGAAVTQRPDTAPVNLDEAERDAILRAIDHEHGNVAGAARRLGVARSTIYRKMVRYGLESGV